MIDMKNLDIEFLLDKSGSMLTTDCPGGKSRWQCGQETTLALATLAQKHDPDGITVVPFASGNRVYESVTAAKVQQVFAENTPAGGTDTAKVLRERLDAYFVRKQKGGAKSVCMFVMTDGQPDDQQAVANVIINATKKMDRDEEIAIQFLQVGNDPDAAKFLAFLDDNLQAQGAKFDIVDTMKIAEVENFSIEALIEKSFTD